MRRKSTKKIVDIGKIGDHVDDSYRNVLWFLNEIVASISFIKFLLLCLGQNVILNTHDLPLEISVQEGYTGKNGKKKNKNK